MGIKKQLNENYCRYCCKVVRGIYPCMKCNGAVTNTLWTGKIRHGEIQFRRKK